MPKQFVKTARKKAWPILLAGGPLTWPLALYEALRNPSPEEQIKELRRQATFTGGPVPIPDYPGLRGVLGGQQEVLPKSWRKAIEKQRLKKMFAEPQLMKPTAKFELMKEIEETLPGKEGRELFEALTGERWPTREERYTLKPPSEQGMAVNLPAVLGERSLMGEPQTETGLVERFMQGLGPTEDIAEPRFFMDEPQPTAMTRRVPFTLDVKRDARELMAFIEAYNSDPDKVSDVQIIAMREKHPSLDEVYTSREREEMATGETRKIQAAGREEERLDISRAGDIRAEADAARAEKREARAAARAPLLDQKTQLEIQRLQASLSGDKVMSDPEIRARVGRLMTAIEKKLLLVGSFGQYMEVDVPLGIQAWDIYDQIVANFEADPDLSEENLSRLLRWLSMEFETRFGGRPTEEDIEAHEAAEFTAETD